MNRILFDPAENRGGEVRLAGPRAHHVWAVLQAQPGDTVRAGEIGGDRYDGARVLVSTPSDCILRLGEASPPLLRAAWDLLLALPRPKCLRRLWPQIAALAPERVYGSLCVVKVTLADAAGNFVPNDDRRVSFAAEGCEILAVGNSDPRGMDSFKDVSSHPLKFGRAGVYLRVKPGVPARLTARADGLESATVDIR